MQRLKLVLYLAEKCSGCEIIKAKMGNTISKLIQYAPNVNFTEVICNGKIEPDLLQKAFHSEADGVLILSCHPEDCHERHQAMRFEPDLDELLDREDLEEDPNLSKAGGAKWISSN